MTRYIIIGAGAVGGALAASLHEQGIDTVLVARGRSLEVIREHGLEYTRPSGTQTFRIPVIAGPSDTRLKSDDVLVLATKTQDADAVLAQWAWQPVAGSHPHATASDLLLITLQNGLDAERAALRRFRHVIGATTLVAGVHTEPGKILTGGAPKIGQLFLGPVEGGTELPDSVLEDLRNAGWLAQSVPDVRRWKAWKLLHNVKNAVELLSGDGNDAQEVSEAISAEARAVFDAAGLRLADPATERTHDPSLAAIDPSSGYSPGQQSTWQSVVRGVPNEADFLNGEIVLLGRLHGVSTPLNAALQQLLGRLWTTSQGPGAFSVDDLRALAAQVVDPTTAEKEIHS